MGLAGRSTLQRRRPPPEGPFSVITTNATVKNLPGGDFDIFVDDGPEKAAYIIYTSHLTAPKDSHRMSIERLTPDYTNSLGQSDPSASSGFFGESFVEAPVMFKRLGVYYALFGTCCCFCGQGSGTVAYSSSNPLGPWTTGSQIGRYPNATSITGAQQRSTFWYPAGATGSKASDVLCGKAIGGKAPRTE